MNDEERLKIVIGTDVGVQQNTCSRLRKMDTFRKS